jgi:G:T-mismatch repair DNA endonuclease (very short patch repair protein)
MADVFTQAKRSEVMSLIRGKRNKQTEGAMERHSLKAKAYA